MVTQYLILSFIILLFFLILCLSCFVFLGGFSLVCLFSVTIQSQTNASLVKILYDQDHATVTATKTKELSRELLLRMHPLSGANLLLVKVL